MNTTHDIIINGGGMVGATLACALGMGGLRVAVIEAREPRPFDAVDDYDLRVSAVSRASQRIFEHLGVWPLMQARRVSPYREMHVWDATGDGEIHFDCAEVGETSLGHIIENRVIQTALLERLHELEGVDWLCPASLKDFSVDDDAVRVTLEDGRELSARLLVGADGPGSRVRELAGIELKAQPYHQKGVVATVRTELPHQSTAWQRFLPTGPLAFLPLADGRCSIVWSADEARAEDLLALDNAAFAAELAEASGHRLGRIESVSKRAGFPLRSAQAQPYVLPRIALVGDAAHSIHPLAGQGANLGFLDAACLADVLMTSRRDIGSLRVLRQYERARKGDDTVMMLAMTGFKQLFGNSLLPLTRLRNAGLGITNGITPVKHHFMRRAMGLAGDLPPLARAIYPAGQRLNQL